MGNSSRALAGNNGLWARLSSRKEREALGCHAFGGSKCARVQDCERAGEYVGSGAGSGKKMI